MNKMIAAVTAALALVVATAAPGMAATAYPTDWNLRGDSSIVTISGTKYVRIPAGSDVRTTKFADTLLAASSVRVCVDSWSNGVQGELYVYGERLDTGDPGAPHTLRFTYDNSTRATRCQTVDSIDGGGLSGAIIVGVAGLGSRVDTVRTVEIVNSLGG